MKFQNTGRKILQVSRRGKNIGNLQKIIYYQNAY